MTQLPLFADIPLHVPPAQPRGQLQPIGDKVVIRRVDAEQTSAGGIVLPDSAQQKPAEGKVLSVGDGRRTKKGRIIPPQVAEGDRVLFASYAGSDVQVGGEELLILSEDDLLAVLE